MSYFIKEIEHFWNKGLNLDTHNKRVTSEILLITKKNTAHAFQKLKQLVKNVCARSLWKILKISNYEQQNM